MTDHWKGVRTFDCVVYGDGRLEHTYYGDMTSGIVRGDYASVSDVDAARAKDAEAHARELAAKDAEIVRLRAQVQQWRDHIDRSAEIENVADLYRHDPLAMADAIVRLREDVGALRAEKD